MKKHYALRIGLMVAFLTLGLGAEMALALENPGKSQVISRVEIPNGAGRVESLRDLYRSGKWESLQSQTQDVLDELVKFKGAEDYHTFDYKLNYYIVTLVDSDFEGKSELIRFIVHDKMTEPFKMQLPGIKPGSDKKCFEVLLTEHPGAQFTSRYDFEKKENPLYAQIPAVVGKLAGVAAIRFSDLVGIVDPDPTPDSEKCTKKIEYKTNDLHAVVLAMDIPFKRASIKVQNKVVLKDRNSAREAFRNAANDILPGFEFQSNCAAAFIQRAITCFLNNDGQYDKKGVAPNPAESYRVFFRTFFAGKKDSCIADIELILAADKAMRAVVPSWTKITSEFTLENVPPTKWTFGLSTAGMKVISDEGRAQIDGGNISYNPLKGAQLMVLVNYHPWGADFQGKNFCAKERLRLFGGGVFTPELGFSAGLGWGLVSGLSLNLGWSALVVDKPKDGETVGEVPTQEDPFNTVLAKAWILGFGFNFK